MSVQFPQRPRGGEDGGGLAAFPGMDALGDFKLGDRTGPRPRGGLDVRDPSVILERDVRMDSWPPPAPAAAVAAAAGAAAPVSSGRASKRCRVAGMYVSAALNLYGSQLFWLGSWEAIDVDPVFLGLFSQTPLRDWLNTGVGALGLVLMDRWYEEGGVPGSMLRDTHGKWFGRFGPNLFGRETSPAGKCAGIVGNILTLLFSSLFWVGVFDVVDDVRTAIPQTSLTTCEVLFTVWLLRRTHLGVALGSCRSCRRRCSTAPGRTGRWLRSRSC